MTLILSLVLTPLLIAAAGAFVAATAVALAAQAVSLGIVLASRPSSTLGRV